MGNIQQIANIIITDQNGVQHKFKAVLQPSMRVGIVPKMTSFPITELDADAEIAQVIKIKSVKDEE